MKLKQGTKTELYKRKMKKQEEEEEEQGEEGRGGGSLDGDFGFMVFTIYNLKGISSPNST